MADEPNITVEILKDIRSEIHETNARLAELRMDTNTRLEQLGGRIVESEMRTATAITALAGTVHELVTHLKGQADLRPRVEKCEVAIVDLQRRLG